MTSRIMRRTSGEVPLSTCRSRALLRVALAVGGVLPLAGCAGAPSITIAGAYFPAWLLCSILAAVVAMVTRYAMVTTGLAELVPFQLSVCLSVGVIAAVIVWRIWVAR